MFLMLFKRGRVSQAKSGKQYKKKKQNWNKKLNPPPKKKNLPKKKKAHWLHRLPEKKLQKEIYLIFHNYLPFELGKRLHPDHPRMFMRSLAENGTVVPEGADIFKIVIISPCKTAWSFEFE